ncbi:MAG: penicillin-binding protein [Lachnospiraceae bacterium]|nr:penicillin-binding protein [Lachnospiraceae bacterium]MDD7023446.1 transglycosylase domain-containing protein [Oscillospiraceae bacterium]MDY5539870.1 transglycosylase domain-containing protein [Lachnospiraceae bacterium]MDY5648279.1 transglycosylase domain-containing protein [Lachnospiraceae bacterium]
MKKRRKKILKCVTVVLLAGFLVLSGVFVCFYIDAAQTVRNSGREIFSQKENSYIYDAQGNVAAKLNTGEDRVYLDYEEIPETAKNAFVAVEDQRFYYHPGVDPIGILRSLFVYIKTGGETLQGGSTITQQLARTVFLNNEVTVRRKVKEIFLALALERAYTKDEILEFYINNVYFANGNYGLEAAAQSYFRKSCGELSVSETALLCAIPNSPTWYNPRSNLEHTLSRRDKILRNMKEQGYLDQEDYDTACRENPKILEKKSEWNNYESSYALDCAVRCLMEQDGFAFCYYFGSDDEYKSYRENYEKAYDREKERIYRGKYKIYTALDPEKQKLLQDSIDQSLERFTEVGADGVYELQAASVILDNETGKVVAISGGRSQGDEDSHTLNRAYQSFRQPGSSIKPLLVYGPALDMGYTKSSTLQEISVEELKKNPAKELSGAPISLDAALYHSKNGAACFLMKKVGVSKGLSYLEHMHFTRLMYSDQNIVSALGGFTYGTNVVEMAGAYRSFTAGGKHKDPTCITSILYNGKEIYKDAKEQEIYSAKTAKEMLELLEGVVTYGTAHRMAWKSDIPCAGKTGTTNNNKDGWFCGMIPDYTMAVWVGCDDPKKVSGLSGSSYPLTIYKSVMTELAKDPVKKEFTVYQTVSSEELTFASSVGAYEDYLPGRADEEELSPGYTVANYRQDHMTADTIDQLLSQAMNATDAKQKEDLIAQAEALKGQIYGRTVTAEVEEKIAYVKEENGNLQ